jgi:SAM-dependent methyltransferase
MLTLEWAVAHILACPWCRGNLASSPRGLVCTACGRSYDVRDGIPALVAGELPREIDAEISWYAPPPAGRPRPFPERHLLAHNAARAPIAEVLRRAGCGARSLILSVATGTGAEIPFVREVSERIVATDISTAALRQFTTRWPYLAVEAEAGRLPFKAGSFDAVVVSGLLHHLAGYAALSPYVTEFLRVVRAGGHLIAVEPNAWYPVQWLMGPINRIGQRIRPGWRGLVPHERPLSPHFLCRQFEVSGLARVEYFSTTFVHNRFPKALSERVMAWEKTLKARRPFRFFGWWVLVWGRKGAAA